MAGPARALARHPFGVRHHGGHLGVRARHRACARHPVRRAVGVAHRGAARRCARVRGDRAERPFAFAGVRALRRVPASGAVARGVLDRGVGHRRLPWRLHLRSGAQRRRLHPSRAVRGREKPGVLVLADHVRYRLAPGAAHHHAPFGRSGGQPREEHVGARAHRGRRAYVLLELVRGGDELLRARVRGGGASVLRRLLPLVALGALP